MASRSTFFYNGLQLGKKSACLKKRHSAGLWRCESFPGWRADVQPASTNGGLYTRRGVACRAADPTWPPLLLTFNGWLNYVLVEAGFREKNRRKKCLNRYVLLEKNF